MTGFQKKIILRALDRLEDLSDWENDFVLSMADKEEDYELSEKQNHALNKIQQKMDFGE